MKLSFPLEQPAKVHFRSISKIEALIFPHLTKFKKQMALLCKFQKDSKDRCFIIEKFQTINIGEAVKLYQDFQNLFKNLKVFS